MWLTGLVAPRHVGSSQTRARTRVPCIGRQILNHCATREAPGSWILNHCATREVSLLLILNQSCQQFHTSLHHQFLIAFLPDPMILILVPSSSSCSFRTNSWFFFSISELWLLTFLLAIPAYSFPINTSPRTPRMLHLNTDFHNSHHLQIYTNPASETQTMP